MSWTYDQNTGFLRNYCNLLSFHFGSNNKKKCLLIILSFHKYTRTRTKKKKKGGSGRPGDRFIEGINSKIISFLRHELYYKRLARFITQKMCSKLSTVHVMCSMCVNPRLNCSRWAGIITPANSATHLPTSALPPRKLSAGVWDFSATSRWVCTLG